jgi:hypothetical protein
VRTGEGRGSAARNRNAERARAGARVQVRAVPVPGLIPIPMPMPMPMPWPRPRPRPRPRHQLADGPSSAGTASAVLPFWRLTTGRSPSLPRLASRLTPHLRLIHFSFHPLNPLIPSLVPSGFGSLRTLLLYKRTSSSALSASWRTTCHSGYSTYHSGSGASSEPSDPSDPSNPSDPSGPPNLGRAAVQPVPPRIAASIALFPVSPSPAGAPHRPGGRVWPSPAWPPPAWPGLARPGQAWHGLAWPRLAPPGRACPATEHRGMERSPAGPVWQGSRAGSAPAYPSNPSHFGGHPAWPPARLRAGAGPGPGPGPVPGPGHGPAPRIWPAADYGSAFRRPQLGLWERS